MMSYGLVFWGNSYHSNTVFKVQKRIIRIMVGIRGRESCREYFRKLKLLPLQSQYIYLLLLFVINNRQHFNINSDIHTINTRKSFDSHYPESHMSVYQKGAHYIGIKVLSSNKALSNDTKQFKMALIGFCISIPFSRRNIPNIIQIKF
jgi:hypothetical protein